MASPEQPDDAPLRRSLSVVLPAQQAGHACKGVVRGYAEMLRTLDHSWEVLLVPGVGADSRSACEQLTSTEPGIRTTASADGWGAAVRLGLRESLGELLCYTNWQRTPPAALAEMLELGLRNPSLVLRANRRTRDTRTRRLGSLLFNLECRVLLQVPAWDVNGTPKVFPRGFGKLLQLRQEDDLLDAEFALVCEREGYPVVEVPIDAPPQSQGGPGVDGRAALRMYLGLLRLRSRGS